MNPFATDHSQSISSLGETKLIENLAVWLGDATPPEPFGMGDDCAILPDQTPGSQQLVTADPIIYGSHFDDTLTPAQAAAKLLRRNLSDIAAMGGRPIHAVVSLALPANVSINWMESFYRSLASEAKQHQVAIVGGDVSSTDNFIGAFLTLYGETIPNTPALPRHSAQAGSPLFVTGSLGGTRLQKHHAFTPRLAEGAWLAKSDECLSCSDLSDGLGKDYINLIPKNLACEIDCLKLPISEDAQATAQASHKDPLYHAINDGEDFELFFALKPDTDPHTFIDRWNASNAAPATHIGYAKELPSENAPKLVLTNTPEGFAATGYEHLR